MQLMPKLLANNIGAKYFKDSKTVFLSLSPCEALDDLAEVMTTGYVSFTHDLTIMLKLQDPMNHICTYSPFIRYREHELPKSDIIFRHSKLYRPLKSTTISNK